MAERILIIEDDKDISRVLKKILESEGYQVECAENGRQALDILERASLLPCMILLDLMMPVMDGFTFRQVQDSIARFAAIPVVIMTAAGDIEEKKIACRAVAALKKPADIEAVIDAVKATCA